MFTSFYFDATSGCTPLQEFAEGVAFLKAAKALYGVHSLHYLALNLPCQRGATHYLHCLFSDRTVVRKITAGPLPIDRLQILEPGSPDILDWSTVERLRIELALRTNTSIVARPSLNALSFAIASTYGETAVFGLACGRDDHEWTEFKQAPITEIRVLARYFHSHILRLNGQDATQELILSARELDCLKWTAAGKTAWEASQILGISERTVRFHLNAAREKLKCATTTQAIAKAVSQQLIAL